MASAKAPVSPRAAPHPSLPPALTQPSKPSTPVRRLRPNTTTEVLLLEATYALRPSGLRSTDAATLTPRLLAQSSVPPLLKQPKAPESWGRLPATGPAAAVLGKNPVRAERMSAA